jgi:pSer/pThr/pTyr-binding forkhead associated (FHA) protein
VGRNEGNDVVVPDQSISLFHALFRKTQDDRILLRDAGSTNGTFINDKKVPVQLQGEPVEVDSGAQVRFGSVKFTFLRLVEFRKLVRELSKG